MKNLLIDAILFCAIITVASFAYAQTWSQSGAPLGLILSGAMSADGSKIIAVGSGNPVVSLDSGKTWATIVDTNPAINFEFQHFTQIASSSLGKKLMTVQGYAPYSNSIYLSEDFGLTWTPRSPKQLWRFCAISADGSKLFAGVNGGLIYKSTDFGTNWIPTGAPSAGWSCITLSADGTKLAAGIGQTTTGKIHISTNSGITWTATSAPSNFWYSIASSADGSHLVATSSSGTYVSTNSGSSWIQFSFPGLSAAVSTDGSKLIIGNIVNNGKIYTSTNFGMNWATNVVQNISNVSWRSVASSADGSLLLAGTDGGLWIYRAISSPQLNLKASRANLAFSWLIPSTNFVLQQNVDLVTTNWVTLTNEPTLNLTNLNNELVLSPSNNSGFFRLISQ